MIVRYVMRDYHMHLLLWVALFFVAIGAFNTCNTELMRVETENADLQRRVEQLERR